MPVAKTSPGVVSAENAVEGVDWSASTSGIFFAINVAHSSFVRLML